MDVSALQISLAALVGCAVAIVTIWATIQAALSRKGENLYQRGAKSGNYDARLAAVEAAQKAEAANRAHAEKINHEEHQQLGDKIDRLQADVTRLLAYHEMSGRGRKTGRGKPAHDPSS